jgi:hypothetical protein
MSAQPQPSKGLTIAYWIFTVLLCLLLSFAGVNHILMAPQVIEGVQHLGFPARMMPFLGVLKLLGAVTLLIGRRGDLTVGAYAGLLFYGLGAFVLHATAGDAPAMMVGSILIIAFTLASYFLWRKTRGRRTA